MLRQARRVLKNLLINHNHMGSIYQLHVIPSGAGVRDLLNKVSEWKKYDCKRNSTK